MTRTFTNASFWNERYDDAHFAYGESANDFLRDHATLFEQNSTILSLAEGEGRNAVFLAKLGCKVRGVDFSDIARDKALQLAEKANTAIDYDLADLTQYDMGMMQWNGIISIFCHPSESERTQLYKQIRQALKSGGIFLLESYHKDQLKYGTGGPKDASHLVTLDEIKLAFNGFDIIHAANVERNVHEGAYHTGLARTTQFIARKPKDTC